MSEKEAKYFCYPVYIVIEVHSLFFIENEADFLLCLDSTDVQFGIYKKLKVGDEISYRGIK